MFPLVLGINVNEVIGIVVLVVSVLSWLVNVIKGNTPDGEARQQKPKPSKGRSEIEELLQELTADKRKSKPEQRPEPPQPPRPPADRSRSKPKNIPQRPGDPPPYTSSRQSQRPAAKKEAPAARRAATNLAPSNLGSGVRSHQMSNRVDTAVQNDIVAPVQHDLGNRIAPAAAVTEKTDHPLVKLLRDPNGFRQAILLNEILQRPKTVRRR